MKRIALDGSMFRAGAAGNLLGWIIYPVFAPVDDPSGVLEVEMMCMVCGFALGCVAFPLLRFLRQSRRRNR